MCHDKNHYNCSEHATESKVNECSQSASELSGHQMKRVAGFLCVSFLAISLVSKMAQSSLQLSVNPDVDHKKWQKERFLLERYFFWTVQNVWLLQQRSTVGFEWPIVKYCFLVYCHDVEEKLVSRPNEVWSSSHTSYNYSWSITSRPQQLALLS